MEFETISAKELDNYINVSHCAIIDLRSAKEYELSHIKSALRIPYEVIEDDFPNFSYNIEYILYCERGGTSLAAAREFSKRGYKTKSVIGGILAYRGKNIVEKQK